MQLVSSREEFQWFLLVGMGYLLSLLPETFLWLGCLSCILILGVPHGALDIYLIWSESKKNIRRACLFLAAYISVILLALGLWRISSEWFWFLFFLSAVYHFGASDEHPELISAMFRNSFKRLLWSYSRGLVLVFAPAAFHSNKILNYLKQATSLDFAAGFVAVAPFLFAYGLTFYLTVSLVSFRRVSSRTYRMLILKQVVSLLLIVALFRVSDPLVGFCLYFCCYHSLNHSFRVFSKTKKSNSSFFFAASLFTIPILPIWFWSGFRLPAGSSQENWVIACFVSIAALTFPHLFMVRKLHETLKRSTVNLGVSRTV
ncbi:MAG: hypothetical protein EBQ92_02875 [Proteobacteria bacterium]|nr:hypothetical protein [Pseudomonadota bacterium]